MFSTAAKMRIIVPARSRRCSYYHSFVVRAGTTTRRMAAAHRRRRRRDFSNGSSSNAMNNGQADASSPEALAGRLHQMAESPGGIATWTERLPLKHRQQLVEIIGKYKAQTQQQVPEPARQDLRLVALNTAIPFIGFGFLDNAILIVAGDAIDTSLGVLLGISTLCAAAIGNIISDVAGIMLGTVIEDFCATQLKLPTPNLTNAQRQLRSVRFASQWGCAVGVVVGCIIGMFPLLFLDTKKVQVMKREKHLDTIFRDVVTEAGSLVGASRTCLYLIVQDNDKSSKKSPVPDPDGKFLYIKYENKADANSPRKSQERFLPLGRGIISRAALTGETWNIADVKSEPDFVPDIGYIDNSLSASSMLCVPVKDSSGRPIAVIQAMNKHGGKSEETIAFADSDVQIIKALASHISVSLQRMYEQAGGEEEETRLKDTISMLKDYGLEGIGHKQKSGHEFQQQLLHRTPHPMVQQPLFPEE